MSRYQQKTKGDIPPKLTMFCSVMAPAQDGSSYNIYIYGGYDGNASRNPPSDSVYVLSLPSFTWVKVYEGEERHGRSNHKCVKPYPDQMLVLGGVLRGGGICVEDGIIRVFNLNTHRFQDTYDPTKWEEYKVPDLVTAQIGGK